MINLDMIGRIRDGKVYVNGLGTGDTLLKLVQNIPPPSPLKLDLSEKLGYAGSDHISFTLHQVPVLFFFSGLHGDYHKPTDTWDKIDSADAAKLLDYVATVATTLESEPDVRSMCGLRSLRLRAEAEARGRRRAVTGRTSAAFPISTSRPRECASPMFATGLRRPKRV